MPKTPNEIASRGALKRLFADGARPSGADFGTLIDSFVHRSEAQTGNGNASANPGNPGGTNGTSGALRLGGRRFSVDADASGTLALGEAESSLLQLGADGQWRIPGGDAGGAAVPLAVDGWFSAAGRVGGYPCGEKAAGAPVPDCDALAPGAALADGKWHVVLPDLNVCGAFEIVAHASGKSASGRHAMLHAVVLTSFNGTRKGVRVTRTQRGWGWLRRLDVRWRARRSGWFARPSGYDLVIRTHFGYGLDDAGKPAQIRFHVTRLW